MPPERESDDTGRTRSGDTPGVRDTAFDQPEHDQQGLELARSLARGYRRSPLTGSSDGSSDRSPGRSPRRPRSARRRRIAGEFSGAHPDDRDPQALEATVARLVSERGWAVDVAVHGLFARWPVIVGTQIAEHCRPESFRDAALTVRADSTAWATQMRLLSSTVVAALNAELGDGTVARLAVLGPQGPSWRHGARTVRGGRGPRDTYG